MLYDITPPITPDLAVFPGDTPVSREVLLDFARGNHLRLSTLRATVHLGAHVDGPNHYGADGRSIDEQPLDLYLGPCQVIHCAAKPGERLGPGDLGAEVRSERVLLRTGTYLDPNTWTDAFAALAPNLVDALAKKGVRLVGIDTPSVDVATAKELVAHHRFLANDMAILEGIVLDDVPEGMYELIALPLRLVGFDASPVRAVLRPM